MSAQQHGWPFWLLLAAVFTAFVGLYLRRCTSVRHIESQSIVVDGNRSAVFEDLTGRGDWSWFVLPSPRLFPWLTQISAVDQRPWDKGKLFFGTIGLPVLGNLEITLKLVQFVLEERLEFIAKMPLQPTVAFEFSDVVKPSTTRKRKTSLQVHFNVGHDNLLFSFLVKPVLQFVTFHQLKQKLLTLQYAMQKEHAND